MHRVACEEVFGATGIPSGEVDGGAVLKCVANRVQDGGLDPKRVTALAGPDAEACWRGEEFAGRPLCDDCARGVRVNSICTGETAQGIGLVPVGVTFGEIEAVGEVFDSVAI